MSFFSSPLGVQSAIVVDNKDPNQLGKVKVNFTWDENSVQSAWASVLQPMAGNSYGVYIVPEVGDTVMVGFLNNNHDNPVVLGSIYTGNANQPTLYDADNYKKNIKTKAGNEIMFYDKPGEERVTITNTENGNCMIFDMKSTTIEISSVRRIRLDAPLIELTGSLITLKGGDIWLDANKSYTKKDGSEMESSGEGSLKIDAEKDIQVLAGDTALLSANTTTTVKSSKDVHIQAVADVKLQGMNINGAADVGVVMKGNATAELSASGQTTVKGGIVMIN